MHWRTLLTPPLSGAENMALDQALMEAARDADEWIFRVYSWASPTISFGRNQTALGRYDAERIAARGYAVVRRPTGGRAILHHREVTYSVTAPALDAGDLITAYARINRILVRGLATLGAHVEVAHKPERGPQPGITPCFDSPSDGELTLGGRKLAGSAQWRTGGGLLQHGSILVDDDQSTLAELVVTPIAQVPPPATLRGVLGRAPTPGEVAHAMFGAVMALEDAEAEPLELAPSVRARMHELLVQYNDAAWTWRR